MVKEYFVLLIKIDIKVRLGMENFIKMEDLWVRKDKQHSKVNGKIVF